MMDRQPFPVIRLELESMKLAILHAFIAQAAQMDTLLQDELKRFCIEDYLRENIRKQVKESVDNSAIKAEIDNYFRYGAGCEGVKTAVIKSLSKVNPWDE